MYEVLGQIAAVGKAMWKYRWQGVAVAWVVAAIGVLIIYRIPDQYEASARIYVDTQSILKPLMSGLAVQPDINQQVGMLSRTLISRPNVEKLVRMADLDLANPSKAQQEANVEGLMKTLQIKSAGRDNLYVLSYANSNPDKAKRAVQSLVSIFVESSLGASRKDTDSAKVFLSEQIKSYQAKLEEAEARLKEFRLRNIELEQGEGKDSASRLGEMSSSYDSAKLELREAENAYSAAKAALQNEKTQGASLSTQSLLQESAITVATPELDARLEAQKRGLDGLLQRFTDQHPDVLSTKRVIKDLEEQKRKEVAELRKTALASPSGGSSNIQNSLAYQELNRMVAMSEVQVAGLRARVSEYGARYNQARLAIKTAPQLEAEAARLNRDYAIHKKNYEDLVGRRESATMSGDLDVASGMADFRLIDPPRVSSKPVSPDRLLLLPLALLAAVVAGLFTAFAASQLRPVFHHAADVRSRIDLPLLGVVSAVISATEERRQRVDLFRFWAASGSLVLIFVAGLTAMSLIAGR
ncbi:MAG: XrtA system polysaccharide chain length determinant [Burkholderiaceae bacterium]